MKAQGEMLPLVQRISSHLKLLEILRGGLNQYFFSIVILPDKTFIFKIQDEQQE